MSLFQKTDVYSPLKSQSGVISYVLPVFIIMIFSFCALLPSHATAAPDLNQEGTKTINEIIVDEIEFKRAKVQDAVRVLAELTGVNIVATEKAGKKLVTLYVRKLSVADIVDSLCRIAGLWYRHNDKTDIFIVMTTDEYQKDIVVYRNEPIRTFKLKYLNVGIAARTIADLFGSRVSLQGKANLYMGNDFDIKDLFDDLYEENDDDGESNSNSDEFNSTVTTSGSTKTFNNPENSTLTAAQIALLEDVTNSQLKAVTEGMVRQISQTTESPIYITINRMHNMLFVRTSDEKAMRHIEQIIEDSDQQVPEVLLEMKVLAVQLTDQFQSAFDISNLSGTTETGPDDGHVINPLDPSSGDVKSSLLGVGNYNVLDGGTFVFQALSSNLRVRLQLLQENNNVSILATPMLLAANNHPARLFVGEETVLTTGFESQEVQVAGGTNVVVNTLPVPVTEVVSVGNTLTILPSINADRSVVMRLIHENSTVEKGGGSIPIVLDDTVEHVAIDTINTSKLEGTVLAQDGMTVAVGGMMRTTQAELVSKVPILGDIPLLGFFFKEQNKVEIKTELVLLITPHILSAPEHGEIVTKDRLGDLLDHPTGLNVYLDDLPAKRAALQKEKNRLSARIIGSEVEVESESVETSDEPEETRVISGLEKSYIELIKVAADQVRTPYLLRQPKGNVTPVTLLAVRQVDIFQDPEVITKPVAAWSNGLHYVTALKVRNNGTSEKPLDVGRMYGSWNGATLENQILAPKGEDGDSTYIYLISDKKFEKAISEEAQ